MAQPRPGERLDSYNPNSWSQASHSAGGDAGFAGRRRLLWLASAALLLSAAAGAWLTRPARAPAPAAIDPAPQAER